MTLFLAFGLPTIAFFRDFRVARVCSTEGIVSAGLSLEVAVMALLGGRSPYCGRQLNSSFPQNLSRLTAREVFEPRR